MAGSIEKLGEEQAIRDVLARYWRGVDRRDPSLIAGAYHPGAYDDHGYFKGPVEGFIESLEPGVWSHFKNTQHFSGQIDVRMLEPDRARTESYTEAHHIFGSEVGGDQDLVYGLRYLDDFAKRNGEWRIAHRVCIWDWHRIDSRIGMPLPETYQRGDRSHKDPVYSQLNAARSDGSTVSKSDLLAKRACYDTLMRYARGVDRCDIDLVRSAYHPGAYDDHGGFQGSVEGFLDWVRPTVMDAFSCTMHKLGNILVEVEGKTAHAETYAIAHHITESEEPGQSTDLVMGVRYLDRLEERSGEWKIAHREMCFEWERLTPTHDQVLLANFKRGLRDGSDPVLTRPAKTDVSTRRPSSQSFSEIPSRLSTEDIEAAELEAKSAIYSLIADNFRSVDRRDLEGMRARHAPDAIIDQGTYCGGLDGLLENFESEVSERFRITMHKLGQVLIEVSGDHASAESYLVCHHIETTTGSPDPRLDKTDLVIGLRSLDQLEKIDGRWLFKNREMRFEWIRTDPLETLDSEWTLGSADLADPSCAKTPTFS